MRTRRPHLDVLLGLQDVEDSLQAVLLGDLVEGVGHLGVELDQVRQGAVPQAGDALGSKSDDRDEKVAEGPSFCSMTWLRLKPPAAAGFFLEAAPAVEAFLAEAPPSSFFIAAEALAFLAKISVFLAAAALEGLFFASEIFFF